MTVEEFLKQLFDLHKRIEDLLPSLPSERAALQGMLLSVAALIAAIQNNHGSQDQNQI